MQSATSTFIAKTFQGLEEVLASEIAALGGKDIETGRRMVSFTGDKELLYKTNLHCRTALRILKPIYTFTAGDPDELYAQIKAMDWTEYLTPEMTFSIDPVVYSDEFRHSKFVTYRAKDAIADFFNERFGKRPSVRLSNADILINLHINQTTCTLSLDSSGESLHRRGYRTAQTEAPLNEVLAAGLLLLAGWDGSRDFIDPMCGSGTLLIEAALIATGTPAGIYRKDFAFKHWNDFDQELFDRLYEDESSVKREVSKETMPKRKKPETKNIRSANSIPAEIQNLKDATHSTTVNAPNKKIDSVKTTEKINLLHYIAESGKKSRSANGRAISESTAKKKGLALHNLEKDGTKKRRMKRNSPPNTITMTK